MDMSIAAERRARVAARAAPGRPDPAAAERGVRRRLGGAAQRQVRPAHRPGVLAVRRQPAEGRAGQVAGPPAARCSSSTSRPAASTSAPRPRSTACWSELAGEGVAILMISSELPEVLRSADRILVMREGRLVAEFAHGGRLRGGDHGRGDRPAAETQAPMTATADRAARAAAGASAGELAQRSPSGCSGSATFGIVAVLVVFVADHGGDPAAASWTQQQHPLHARQTPRLRAARAGRDDGGHHPERRPVGRLGARPLRLRLGQHVRPATTGSRSRSSSSSAWASGWPAGSSTALITAIGRVPEPGRHARDAVHHPRRRHRSSSAAARSSARPLPNSFLNISTATVLGHPRPGHRGRGGRSRIGAYYLRSFRSGRELYAIGSNPDAARLAGHPDRQAHLHRVRAQRRDRRGGRRAVGGPVRDDRLDRGDRLRAAGHRRGGRRRRGDLRRQRQRGRRRPRRAAAADDQLGAERARHLVVWTEAISGFLLLAGDHARPGHLAAAGRRAATEECPPLDS